MIPGTDEWLKENRCKWFGHTLSTIKYPPGPRRWRCERCGEHIEAPAERVESER